MPGCIKTWILCITYIRTTLIYVSGGRGGYNIPIFCTAQYRYIVWDLIKSTFLSEKIAKTHVFGYFGGAQNPIRNFGHFRE